MRFIKPPFPAKLLYREAVWRNLSGPDNISITFDDGPSEATPEILKVLEQYHIKATFFCVGKQVEKFPGNFKLIQDKGHAIGNHTYSHLNGWNTSTTDYISDVRKAAEIIPSALFRPPYGKITPLQYYHLKKDFKIIFWNVMSYDFDEKISTDSCSGIISKYTRVGSIIVLHDKPKSLEKTIFCLKKLLSI